MIKKERTKGKTKKNKGNRKSMDNKFLATWNIQVIREVLIMSGSFKNRIGSMTIKYTIIKVENLLMVVQDTVKKSTYASFYLKGIYYSKCTQKHRE